MRKISTDEQARMVTVAVSSFNDLCDIYHFVSSIDSLSGEVLTGYDSSPSLATACGFVETSALINFRGEIVTIDADAILRTAASIKIDDKVVTHNKNFIVNGVTTGRDVTICKLKEIKI